MSQSNELLYAKLNQETAKLCWRELEPHFARGAVIKVGEGLDLVTVAACVAEDDATTLGSWFDEGLVSRVNDRDATEWSRRGDSQFWAVVVFPWVLIQPVADADSVIGTGIQV